SWHRLCAGGGGRGQQRSVSRRRRRRAELRAPREDPFVLRPGRSLSRRPRRLHAGAHRTGPELRRLRLGHLVRHDLARDHDPARSPPRADHPRFVSDDGPPPSLRPHAPAGHLRALDPGAHRPAVQCRRRRLAIEPRLLALQHAAAARDLGAVQSPAGGNRQAGDVRQGRGKCRARAIQPAGRRGAGPVSGRAVAAADRRVPRLGPTSHLPGGTGVVAAAAAGLLADNPTIFYAGTLDGNTKLLHEVVTPAAQLVLTDSNRKVLERWSSVSDNIGETLPAVSEPSTPDPTSVALPIFAHVGLEGQSVTVYSGARYVTASAYGNPITLTPEDRPSQAFDGDTETAWSVAAFSGASGN